MQLERSAEEPRQTRDVEYPALELLREKIRVERLHNLLARGGGGRRCCGRSGRREEGEEDGLQLVDERRDAGGQAGGERGRKAETEAGEKGAS